MRTEVLQALRDSGPGGRFALASELVTTDVILQRWASSVGDGLPTDRWDDRPVVKLPPLPDDVAIVVDQYVIKSPRRTRDIVSRWYKTPEPAETIAGRLGMSRASLYTYRSIALNFMRWKFEGSDNAQLVRLVRGS